MNAKVTTHQGAVSTVSNLRNDPIRGGVLSVPEDEASCPPAPTNKHAQAAWGARPHVPGDRQVLNSKVGRAPCVGRAYSADGVSKPWRRWGLNPKVARGRRLGPDAPSVGGRLNPRP
jgi:hypothetical protein